MKKFIEDEYVDRVSKGTAEKLQNELQDASNNLLRASNDDKIKAVKHFDNVLVKIDTFLVHIFKF